MPYRNKTQIALEELLEDAPMFPLNYDDHVLAIEQGFKPKYIAFLQRLKDLV